MFAISLSFLIFSASTFSLLSHLMVSQIETMTGADVYGIAIDYSGLSTIIDDGRISQFL